MQGVGAEGSKRREHLGFQVCGKAAEEPEGQTHREGQGKERPLDGASGMNKGTERSRAWPLDWQQH